VDENGMTPQAERFMKIVSGPDESINLAEAALVIASEEYVDLDIAAYLARIADMATALKRRLRPDISAADTIIALNRYLYEEQGYAGNTESFYDPRNSFLNDVLDRRRGIPITLALVYIEVGRRIGLPLFGISFPAHFLVKCVLREGTVVLDPYARGVSLGFDDLMQRLKGLQPGTEPSKSALAAMLVAASNKEILVRMLRNLKAIYMHRRQWQKALTATDRIIDVAPDAADDYRDRGMLYLNLECFRAALFDLQSYLKMMPDGRDAESVRMKVVELQNTTARLN
jgi:regulator of sirC expression with transglutaminase-like and TPR domain